MDRYEMLANQKTDLENQLETMQVMLSWLMVSSVCNWLMVMVKMMQSWGPSH